MTEIEKKILSLLPKRISEAIVCKVALTDSPIDEIRLRYASPPHITSRSEILRCTSDLITKKELSEALTALAGGVIYPHSDSIRVGFFATEDGVRIGITGRSNSSDGHITSVFDITSLNIRIPHSAPSAGEIIRDVLKHESDRGIIINSAPGIGKTTVLREFLSSCNDIRVCAIDTRFELCPGGRSGESVDVLSGYPRDAGIEIALRCMSPEIIVCDEIGSESDAHAIEWAYLSGIKVIASAHAPNFDSLMQREVIGRLFSNGIMGASLTLLKRSDEGYVTDLKIYDKERFIS